MSAAMPARIAGAPLLDVAAVCTRVGVTRTTIYEWMRERDFPRGYALSTRCRRWDLEQIEAWIAAQATPARAIDGSSP